MADDAGALLVRSGLVSSSALENARVEVLKSGGTVGEKLVEAGAIADDALADFYRQRLLVPQVNPNTLAKLPAKAIAAIPAGMAIELRVVPVALDADDNLTVAMSDPSDRHAVDAIASQTGAYVVRAVATQMQIAWCLAHYYGHVTTLGERLINPESPAEAAPEEPRRARRMTDQVKQLRTKRLERGAVMVSDVMAELAAATQPKLDESGPIMIIEAGEPSGPVMTIDVDSGPVISIERPGSEDLTDRKMPAPRRKRPARTDPPELAARAGEVQLATGQMKAIDFDALPSIMISEELERALRPSAVIVAEEDPAAPQSEVDPDDEMSEVIVLELKKPRPRAGSVTQVGIGVVAATTRARSVSEVGEDTKTDVRRVVDDVTRVDTHAVEPGEYTSASDELLAAPPAPTPTPADDALDTQPIPASPRTRTPSFLPYVDDDDDDVKTKPTMVMSAAELDEVIPDRLSDPLFGTRASVSGVVGGEIGGHGRDDDRDDDDNDDERWGPPGTTIPPPLLGAIPGSLDRVSGVIPIPDIDTGPLIVAPPSPPQTDRIRKEHDVARVLEDATARVLELIHTLDHATERDQIIAVLIAHLANSHQRAGFFAARNGELTLFAITPRVPSMPSTKLRLDRPSTLQDVVGTRLPYRGPVVDEASRAFLQATLGAAPPEMLLVPIAVRERIVGILFADHRVKHTFDDQLALAARAAGMALERILKARRA